MLDFSEQESAVIVSPEYRLLPEATGHDIIADLEDFWKWLAQDLPNEISRMVRAEKELDLHKVAITGESAGAYLAVQSCLIPRLIQSNIHVCAVLLQSPMIDLGSDHYSAYPTTTRRIKDHPQFPRDLVTDHLKNLPQGRVVTSADPSTTLRNPLGATMLQQGLFGWRLGDDGSGVCYPFSNLEMMGYAQVVSMGSITSPAVWALHSWQDTVISVEGCINFCRRLKQLFPATPLLLDIGDGEHGFDEQFDMETPMIQRGLEFVKEYWTGAD
ncbi:hypothetical protein K402DRAFT_122889 [Aulographum hederae CBS 113979]|uniref:Alpha/beta hydrolase fold-3 domain-containing protein n=1 Tax=Aulographum hederae CBS 113979 TaxID=1176131 RepID=A0A6G1HDS6_9PEZI|nr:hypothetical protein K402DRAFT_122889 [Aulographum hederae CBS 113979]